jgi:hypothetical protein
LAEKRVNFSKYSEVLNSKLKRYAKISVPLLFLNNCLNQLVHILAGQGSRDWGLESYSTEETKEGEIE